MAQEKKHNPPEPSTGDKGYLLVNAVLSIIPGAAELFQYFISPPLEKRREQWMKNVGGALQELEKNRGVRLEDLQSNELFITILTQASNSAIRSHQKEKLEYLRSAVINTIFQTDVDEDMKLLFIRYIDELTVSHIILLNFLSKNELEIAEIKSYEQLFQNFTTHNFLLKLERDAFKLLCQELISRNLIRISSNVDDFTGIYEVTHLISESTIPGPKIKVTLVGKNFLGFINQNAP